MKTNIDNRKNIIISLNSYYGERKKGIQIGTVGTLPEFRARGLSGTLMNYILAKYKDDSDLFFLFANDSVLEFYPKYGFSRKYETLYYSGIKKSEKGKTLKKLNWKKQDELDFIRNLLKQRLPLTSMFGAENYQPITLWHMINIYPGDIYYEKDQNLILIFNSTGETLHLIDLIFTEYPDMEKTLSYISGSGNTSTICFHFPPDITNFNFDRIAIDRDDMFFTRGKFNPPDGYKFPVTAQT